MFHHDITTEDTRIIAHSSNGAEYNVTFINQCSGNSLFLVMLENELLPLIYCSISSTAEQSPHYYHALAILEQYPELKEGDLRPIP